MQRRGRTVGAVGGKPLGLEAEAIGRTLDHGAGSANLGLADRTCRLDVENDRCFWIDQVIVGIGEERMPFVSASPLRCGIGSGDELRHGLAGGTPCGIVERVEIFPHRAAARGEAAPVDVLSAGDRPPLVGIGGDQAGVHRKSFAANQPFLNTAAHHDLEDMPKRIAFPEATMAVLRKGRVIGTLPSSPSLQNQR